MKTNSNLCVVGHLGFAQQKMSAAVSGERLISELVAYVEQNRKCIFKRCCDDVFDC
jgi:hypothetical protein